jgi:hypothetical protein
MACQFSTPTVDQSRVRQLTVSNKVEGSTGEHLEMVHSLSLEKGGFKEENSMKKSSGTIEARKIKRPL